MAKSLGYCLWSLGFVLAIVFTLEEKPRRLYILSTILLTGSLISAIYGLGAYLQDRHTTENPRLHESFIPLARCQVPLDKPHTEIDVTRLSNTACIDLAQRNGESMQYPYWRLQSYGKLNHSVLAALVYGLCLSLCVALQQGTPRRYRIPLTMAALVFVITLYLCGSLGILVGFAVALVFVITHQLVSDRHWRQRYWLALIGVAIGGLLLSNEYISVLITYLPRGLSFRDVIWSEMVAQMSLSTWLWGHGLGHSLQIRMDSGVSFPHPHSIYFTMLHSTGAVGLTMLLAILTTALTTTYRLATPQAKIAGTLLAFGMGALAVDGDQIMTKLDVHWLLIWLPLAMIAAQQLRSKTSSERTMLSTD
jgi:hypothetical protein